MSQREGALPNLLVLASTYPRWAGDAEPGFVHELAKRLTSDFNVTVLAPRAPGAASREKLDGVTVHRYRYAPAALETLVNDGGMLTNLRRQPWKWLLVPGFLLGLLWNLLRLTRRLRPSVVHAHWLIPQGFAIALLSAIWPAMPPFVVTSHGADLFSLKSRLMCAAKRFVISRAAAVTVVSSAMREEIERIGAEGCSLSVQPMGVDLLGAFSPNYRVARSRDELLFVGRMVEKKGLAHLIDAMPAVIEARPEAFLTVVGFGPEEGACRRRVAQLGLEDKVRFVGPMQQRALPELYRRAAVFVAPFVIARSGDQEGLGLVSVEAAGCECPIVTSELPAVQQVFPDRALLKMVRPGDPTALASAIVQQLDDRESATSNAVRLREDVLRRFDWTIVVRGYARTLGAVRRVVP